MQKINRRDFVKQSVTSTITISSGVSLITYANAKSADTAVTDEKRWGMLVDTNKLTDSDIDTMINACKKEHGWGDEKLSNDAQKAQWVKKVVVKDKMTGKVDSLPLMCQHCENPPCVDVCPTGASMKRKDGIVLVDRHRCIGCRYCMMACPYEARSFVHETITNQKAHMPRGKGTVESCTLCVHKVDKGEQPACVSAVKSDAIIFGDLYDSNSKINKALKTQQSSQIRSDLNLNTGVRYSGL
ncbi:Sulfite reduction-associated complex DsrMKJOP iron-sulfur protein DsrO (=HmeA) [hydrothermal vent metagenome]|uniref:Sulfite reduction-associated complex DsrMKJOP iron-sulfur protein DsrO (=HmeA) n=1 Tax=hydrothermal vent metagenome TaxID=652676 RepID=A0A1W1BLZ2_9ZZZZ